MPYAHQLAAEWQYDKVSIHDVYGDKYDLPEEPGAVPGLLAELRTEGLAELSMAVMRRFAKQLGATSDSLRYINDWYAVATTLSARPSSSRDDVGDAVMRGTLEEGSVPLTFHDLPPASLSEDIVEARDVHRSFVDRAPTVRRVAQVFQGHALFGRFNSQIVCLIHHFAAARSRAREGMTAAPARGGLSS